MQGSGNEVEQEQENVRGQELAPVEVAFEDGALEEVALEEGALEEGTLEVVASEVVASEVEASEVVASEVVASEVVASEVVASEAVASVVVVSEVVALEEGYRGGQVNQLMGGGQGLMFPQEMPSGEKGKKKKKNNTNKDEAPQPKRQKLQIEHEHLRQVEETHVEVIKDSRGAAGKMYRCKVCSNISSTLIRAVGHASKCGEASTGRKRGMSTKQLKCNQCNFRSTTILKMKEHRLKVHISRFKHRYSCTRCRVRLSNSKCLARHVTTKHLKLVTYPCNMCSNSFSTKSNLKRHIEESHELLHLSSSEEERGGGGTNVWRNWNERLMELIRRYLEEDQSSTLGLVSELEEEDRVRAGHGDSYGRVQCRDDCICHSGGPTKRTYSAYTSDLLFPVWVSGKRRALYKHQ